jgi:hypothetical protein
MIAGQGQRVSWLWGPQCFAPVSTDGRVCGNLHPGWSHLLQTSWAQRARPVRERRECLREALRPLAPYIRVSSSLQLISARVGVHSSHQDQRGGKQGIIIGAGECDLSLFRKRVHNGVASKPGEFVKCRISMNARQTFGSA